MVALGEVAVLTISVNMGHPVYLITMVTSVIVQEVVTMVTGVRQMSTTVKLVFVTKHFIKESVWTKSTISTANVIPDSQEIGARQLILPVTLHARTENLVSKGNVIAELAMLDRPVK